jgi:hypothetical protein
LLLAWYALWRDENGEKRTIDEARWRYEIWRQDARYVAVPALRRVLSQLSDDRCLAWSQFWRDPAWEATTKGAERTGRAFRHGQAPHLNLRSVRAIEGALTARLHRRLEAALGPPPAPIAVCRRGRRPPGWYGMKLHNMQL